MRFNSFEGFGVEVSKNGEVENTRFFDGIKEAIEYANERTQKGFSVSFLTVNKWGSVIDRID